MLIVSSDVRLTAEINKYELTFRNTVNGNKQEKWIELHTSFKLIKYILAPRIFNNQYFIESLGRLQSLLVLTM